MPMGGPEQAKAYLEATVTWGFRELLRARVGMFHAHTSSTCSCCRLSYILHFEFRVCATSSQVKGWSQMAGLEVSISCTPCWTP